MFELVNFNWPGNEIRKSWRPKQNKKEYKKKKIENIDN